MTRFLAVMACLLVVVCIVPQVTAGTLTVTDPTQFTMRVRAVTAGTTINGSSVVTLTAPGLNTTAEYYQLVVTVAGAAGWHVVELDVPDCYMGLSVEQLYPNGSWANVDGNANFSLSVPYTWTLKSAPALDWGSVVALPPGEQATMERMPVKRVQLAMNGTALPSATLRLTIYYATSAAIGFDGVNDYVRFGAVPFGINDAEISLTMKQIRINPNEYYKIIGGMTMSPYRGILIHQNKITGLIYYNWRDFGEPFDNTNWGSTGEVSPLLGVKKTIAARFIRSNDTYQFLVNGVVVNQGSKSTFSQSNLTTSRWERGSAFLSGAAAASAFFSYLLLQVGLGDDLITGLFALISVASGSFSAYLYHKVKTEGGY